MKARGKVQFAGDVPKCVEANQYQVWKEAARHASQNLAVAGFCTDCTPAYQKKMILAGRCENPRVVFVRDDDGWISGALLGERTTRDVQLVTDDAV